MSYIKSLILYILHEVRSRDLFIFIAILAIYKLVSELNQIRKLPPGPWGVPFLGYLPFMTSDRHLQFSDLAKKYGGLFSTKVGNQLIVIISDYKLIRETFRKEEYTGRPRDQLTNIIEGYGVINCDGRLWKNQRKFLHSHLRSFGMTCMGKGKQNMQLRIMREVNVFLRNLCRSEGNPLDLNSPLALSASNVICSIIMNIRFHLNDPRFQRYTHLIEEGFKLFGGVMQYVNFIPILGYLPGQQKTKQKIEANRAEMAQFFEEIVQEHRKTFDNGNIRDVVDAYLQEIEVAEEEGRTDELFEGKDHNRQMHQIIGDLFTAGMETVKTTLQWAVVFMLHHPEIAKQVQEELDQVVGRHRLPNLQDLPFLPFTESTLLEVLRRSSIVPLGTPHAVTRDVQLNGYTIPKDTQVVPLLHAVHMDPDLWESPEKFMPTRFLNSEGKVTKPEYFLPFGVGRRMCLGEVLAKMEIFLYFTSLLHVFDISVPEGKELPNLKGFSGVTITPESFEVCLTQRPLENRDFEFMSDEPSHFRSTGSH
nr:PREDICTED: cytochrome P450 18a1 [Bemisia tabaci]